jgi:hypothetical protein
MFPHAVDFEQSTFMNGGSASTDGAFAIRGSSSGLSVHVTTFNCANNPHPRPPIALPELPPDLLVLGLQELAPSHIAFLNLPVVENIYLRGLESVPDIARKQYGIEYEKVRVVRVGQTALAVWSSLGSRLKKVQTAWAGCGLLGLLANKGAAAVRLTVVDGTATLSHTDRR